MRNPYQLESKSGLKHCYAQAFNKEALGIMTQLYILPGFGNQFCTRKLLSFFLISAAIDDVFSSVTIPQL